MLKTFTVPCSFQRPCTHIMYSSQYTRNRSATGMCTLALPKRGPRTVQQQGQGSREPLQHVPVGSAIMFLRKQMVTSSSSLIFSICMIEATHCLGCTLALVITQFLLGNLTHRYSTQKKISHPIVSLPVNPPELHGGLGPLNSPPPKPIAVIIRILAFSHLSVLLPHLPNRPLIHPSLYPQAKFERARVDVINFLSFSLTRSPAHCCSK